MSNYAWAITRDYIFDPEFDKKRATGITGPRGITLTYDQIRKHEKAQKFRLKDGDDIVYFHGVLVDLDGETSGFEPLSDFGIGYAGACTIEYFEGGKWAEL